MGVEKEIGVEVEVEEVLVLNRVVMILEMVML
jgi:hypothetical protein